MDFSILEIEFGNGRIRHYPKSEFDYFPQCAELEHISENIIVNVDDPSSSFCYQLDDNDEIAAKEPIKVCFIQ